MIGWDQESRRDIAGADIFRYRVLNGINGKIHVAAYLDATWHAMGNKRSVGIFLSRADDAAGSRPRDPFFRKNVVLKNVARRHISAEQ
jgi:hypothetical protein